MLSVAGQLIYSKRAAFVAEFVPIFQSFYSFISQDREPVSLEYTSHAAGEVSLQEQLRQGRDRDRLAGFTLHGIHKDDLTMQLDGYSMRREGSQGQNKTYLVALKLAQFDFLKRTGGRIPLLLLDDIFDKLDATRTEQIVKLVAGDRFGQIFITDTNREHLDNILRRVGGNDYRIFGVEQGRVTPWEGAGHEA
jgi:DNA replication and repair protein RecF